MRIQQPANIPWLASAADHVSKQPFSFSPFGPFKQLCQVFDAVFPKEECGASTDIRKVQWRAPRRPPLGRGEGVVYLGKRHNRSAMAGRFQANRQIGVVEEIAVGFVEPAKFCQGIAMYDMVGPDKFESVPS